MLNDFSVIIETEKIHGHVLFVTRPCLVRVKGHQITLGYSSYKFDAFIRVVPGHFCEVVDERLLAIANQGVVLSVIRPHILSDCMSRLSGKRCGKMRLHFFYSLLSRVSFLFLGFFIFKGSERLSARNGSTSVPAFLAPRLVRTTFNPIKSQISHIITSLLQLTSNNVGEIFAKTAPPFKFGIRKSLRTYLQETFQAHLGIV